MSGATDTDAMRIVIAGGGVAGLEAALALRDLAGEHVAVDLVAPDRTFIDRPMTVLEPFGDILAERFPLSDILSGQDIHHRVDSIAWIDRRLRQAHTRGGESLGYDALLLCPGARAQPAYPHAITILGGSQDADLAGLVSDLDAGAVRRIAFLVPAAGTWQLPLYELALLTAARAAERGLDASLSIFTPEPIPMEAFGDQAGSAAHALLADAGIEVVCRAACQVPDSRTLLVDSADGRSSPRERLAHFDRILALPRLRGPRIRGVPAVSGGFIPVDVHGRILGAHAELAAGDATNCAVKHGSIAAQQADAAAGTIAALAGAAVRPAPFHPVARGVLLTGDAGRRLSASIVGGHSLRSTFSASSATVTEKLDAQYLSPRLAALRAAGPPG